MDEFVFRLLLLELLLELLPLLLPRAAASVETIIKTVVKTQTAADAAAAPAVEASVLILYSFSCFIFHFDLNVDVLILGGHRWYLYGCGKLVD